MWNTGEGEEVPHFSDHIATCYVLKQVEDSTISNK